MFKLSPLLRWLLGGAAAVVGFLAAFDPFGLSHTAQGIVACLAVLFGALGVVPPQVGGTQIGVLNPTAVDTPPSENIQPRSTESGQAGVGLIVAILIVLLIVLLIPVTHSWLWLLLLVFVVLALVL